MTTGFWCVLCAALLPYVWVVCAKSGGISNRTPRLGLDKLSGWRQRANWAQANAWEAFAPFAAAVIIAHVRGADQSSIDMWAALFVGFRVLHGVVYITDKPAIRSIAWTGGIVSIVALFLI